MTYVVDGAEQRVGVRFPDLLCRGFFGSVRWGLRVALVERITGYWRVLRRRLIFWGGLVFVEGFVHFGGF